MPGTVIIPAHDEAAVIRRNLRSLLDGLPAEVDVVVVCNGCVDDTAARARSVDGRIRVFEIDPASKTAALNHGDAEAHPGPRVYLDADVALTGAAVAALVDAVTNDRAVLAEPRVVFDLDGSTAAVRWFYDVWVALHGEGHGDIGGGALALSEAGRSRFGSFPDVVADDGYVRAHFSPRERVVVDVSSVVVAPRTTASLVRIKARSRIGNTELKEAFPDLWHARAAQSESLTRKAARLPVRVWPKVPVYVAILMRARLRARRLSRRGALVWDRDLSSRTDR